MFYSFPLLGGKNARIRLFTFVESGLKNQYVIVAELIENLTLKMNNKIKRLMNNKIFRHAENRRTDTLMQQLFVYSLVLEHVNLCCLMITALNYSSLFHLKKKRRIYIVIHETFFC